MNHINLTRYLIVMRVNGAQVRLPASPVREFSQGLGKLIARRLPTRTRHPWQMFLDTPPKLARQAAEANEPDRASPFTEWPIESTLLLYPTRRFYGAGERILCELKLFGEHADHGYFLEVLLPALEEGGFTTDLPGFRRDSLWGHFEIQSIYAAAGSRWEVLATDGKLDLHYQPTPRQWLEGWRWDLSVQQLFNLPTQLTWLTPFHLHVEDPKPRKKDRQIPAALVPRLQDLLEALLYRIQKLMGDPGENVLDLLESEERSVLLQGLETVSEQGALDRLVSVNPAWPGSWIGTQIFEQIPIPLVPYLELASVLHVGQQTHFGCGTFYLQQAH